MRRQWAAPTEVPVSKHRIPSAKYMNPFEMHPDAYPESSHPKQERKQWKKRESDLDLDPDLDIEEFGFVRPEKQKFSNYDEA